MGLTPPPPHHNHHHQQRTHHHHQQPYAPYSHAPAHHPHPLYGPPVQAHYPQHPYYSHHHQHHHPHFHPTHQPHPHGTHAYDPVQTNVPHPHHHYYYHHQHPLQPSQPLEFDPQSHHSHRRPYHPAVQAAAPPLPAPHAQAMFQLYPIDRPEPRQISELHPQNEQSRLGMPVAPYPQSTHGQMHHQSTHLPPLLPQKQQQQEAQISHLNPLAQLHPHQLPPLHAPPQAQTQHRPKAQSQEQPDGPSADISAATVAVVAHSPAMASTPITIPGPGSIKYDPTEPAGQMSITLNTDNLNVGNGSSSSSSHGHTSQLGSNNGTSVDNRVCDTDTVGHVPLSIHTLNPNSGISSSSAVDGISADGVHGHADRHHHHHRGASSPQSSNRTQMAQSKRQRATKACDTCNRKKIRCDSKQPLCGYCSHSGQACTYSRTARKRGPKPGYIEGLENYVKELEKLLKNLPEGDTAAAATATAAAARSLSLSIDEHSDEAYSDDRRYHHDPDNDARHNGDCSHSDTDSSDHGQPAADRTENGPLEPHCQNLNHSDSAATLNASASTPAPMPLLVSRTFTSSTNDSQINDNELRHDLIDYFFTYLYPAFPVLHRPTFVQTAATESPLLINAFYAYTSHFARTDQLETTQMYDTIARKHINYAIEQPSYSTVVGIILLSLHACNVGQMTESWVYFGIAVRIAQQMRLHLEPSIDHASFTPHVQEYRRRIWWALYEIDRFMCMTSKLAFTIREIDFKVRYPCTEALWLRNDNSSTSVVGPDQNVSLATTGASARVDTAVDMDPASAHSHKETSVDTHGQPVPVTVDLSRVDPDATSDPSFCNNTFSIDYYYVQLLELATAVISFRRTFHTSQYETSLHVQEIDAQMAGLETELQGWSRRAPAWLRTIAETYRPGLDVDAALWENGSTQPFASSQPDGNVVLSGDEMPKSKQDRQGSPSSLPWKAAFVQILLHYMRILIHGREYTRLLCSPDTTVHVGAALASATCDLVANVSEHLRRQGIVGPTVAISSHPSYILTMDASYTIAAIVDKFLEQNRDFRHVSPFVYVGIAAAGDILLQSVHMCVSISSLVGVSTMAEPAPPLTTKQDQCGDTVSVASTQPVALITLARDMLKRVDRLIDALDRISVVSASARSSHASMVVKRQAIHL